MFPVRHGLYTNLFARTKCDAGYIINGDIGVDIDI